MAGMIVRQISDLVEGTVVGERKYSYERPRDILEVLRLMLRNCADFMRSEGIPISQDTIELHKLTLGYPGWCN